MNSYTEQRRTDSCMLRLLQFLLLLSFSDTICCKMLSLWNLIKAVLLFINALAILHEKRFLKK